MKQSIMSNVKRCYICNAPEGLHQHHIFEGTANRAMSDKFGCWVWLCGYHHNLSNEGVHKNKPFEISLKKHCQEKWESLFGSRVDFIKTFGKSYIWEDSSS